MRALARDRAGNQSEAILNITVDKTPPTVTWLEPADGAVVSGTVPLRVEATDNVGVAKVEFFAGSTKIGEDNSAPYEISWNTAAYPDGPVTLKARAVDGAGNVSSEATLTVTVANAPEIVWLSPTPNQKLAGAVELQVEVRARRAVDRVEFYFGDTPETLVKISGFGSVDPSGVVYTLSWDVLRVSPGSYLLKAVVVDVSGSRGEATIPVEVTSTFEIFSPKDGDQVGPGAQRQIVTVTVGVNGTLPAGVGVTRVEIYINGQSVGNATAQTAGDGSQIYVYAWDTAVAVPGHDPTASGDRVITARVYDTGGDTFTNGVRLSYLP